MLVNYKKNSNSIISIIPFSLIINNQKNTVNGFYHSFCKIAPIDYSSGIDLFVK